MIIGIGNDICEVARIEKALQRHGDRFVSRCFTEIERQKSDRRAQRAASYAKRFSAKRARSGHATTFLLRLQPALWQAVKDDAAESGRSMQIVVREILSTPYRKKEDVT